MICKYSLIKSKDINKTEDTLIVEFPNVSTINNKDCLVLKIDKIFTELSNYLKVVFKINNNKFSVMTPNGNIVRANQLRENKVYVVSVSTENSIMIMKCYLPPSGLKYPDIIGCTY